MTQKFYLNSVRFWLAFIRNLSYILGKIKQKERFKTMKKYCLVSALMNDESLKKLNTILGIKYNIIYNNPNGGKIEKFTDEEIENAEIIIGNPSAETLKKCKNLKWLQLNSSGADFYARNSGVSFGRRIYDDKKIAPLS